MKTDLIERLRAKAITEGPYGKRYADYWTLMLEAAERLAALEAEASEGERRGLERAIGLVEVRASKHSFLQAKSYEAGLDHAGAMFHTQHCEAHNIAAAIRALIPEAPVREVK